jgi:sodium/bile acid cotransporter 7
VRKLLILFRDPYIVALVSTVLLATVLPCRGAAVGLFTAAQNAAICLLFFVHGAKLSRDAILKGSGNWRLHLSVLGSTYLVFPILGLAACALASHWLPQPLLIGLLFLTLLPSTVQSSIAFTAIARGNVPAAICSASLSNLLGIFITPLLVQLLLGHAGKGLSWSVAQTILLQLLLPFFLGHLSRPWTSGFIGRHKLLTTLVDRGSILLVVYVAFSAAVVQGIWHLVSPGDFAITVAISILILAAVLTITMRGARLLGFSRPDEVVMVFCGSKKSLASGVPMAGVLFPAATVGAVIVPLMLFHQLQLMACAVLARRYADADDKAHQNSSV